MQNCCRSRKRFANIVRGRVGGRGVSIIELFPAELCRYAVPEISTKITKYTNIHLQYMYIHCI
jgi:hypothetical protein